VSITSATYAVFAESTSSTESAVGAKNTASATKTVNAESTASSESGDVSQDIYLCLLPNTNQHFSSIVLHSNRVCVYYFITV